MAGFQIKTVVVSSVSAVIFGQTIFMVLTLILGPGLNFVAGAGTGFIGGLVHRWRTNVSEAKEALQQYPELMEHHLRNTEPQLLKAEMFEQWKKGVWQGHVVNQGHAMGALYSASPAIQRIKEMVEENIITASIDNMEK